MSYFKKNGLTISFTCTNCQGTNEKKENKSVLSSKGKFVGNIKINLITCSDCGQSIQDPEDLILTDDERKEIINEFPFFFDPDFEPKGNNLIKINFSLEQFQSLRNIFRRIC